jgi:dihydrolipoamide dehydrogenase
LRVRLAAVRPRFEVTVLEALPKILPGLDADITKVVERSFKKRGIEVRTDVKVTGHTPGESGTKVEFGDGESVDADLVVVSVGRRPFSDLLGLDETEVEVSERGFVEVDENCRTSVEGVWAVGDLVATPSSPTSASPRAWSRSATSSARIPHRSTTTAVPWCIYCHPEVAFAGYSEEAAKEAGTTSSWPSTASGGNGRAMIVGEPDGMVKIIAEKTRRLRPVRSSACTWSARGPPSCSARPTSRSTGRPPSTRSPTSSSPTRP